MTEAPLLSFVVPVDDPQVDAAALVEAYSAPLGAAGKAHEFVFVLDGMRGGIESELRALRERFPIKIVTLQGGGLGPAVALQAGASRAAGQFIINAPQYLQVVPEDVLKVVQALEGGAEFVATWRRGRVDPWLNRLQSRLFNWMLRILMGIQFHDINSGLRGMRKEVVEEVNVYGELYRFLPVLAMRHGFRTVEVKVRHREEKGRRGIYGLGVYVNRLLDILAVTFLTRFTQKPLRFFGMLGLIAMVVGVALCVNPLFGKLVFNESIQDKPIFVLGSVLFAFGIQLIGLGVVGEIIIFTQARNLRDYKVEEFIEEVAEVAVQPSAQPLPADGRIAVRELIPGEDARWDRFVRAHADGSVFHLSGWRKVVEDVFRHEAHYLIAERGGEVVGALPVFRVKSPFLGHTLISTPYAVYGGILADDGEAVAALRSAVAAVGSDTGAAYVELRHRQRRFPELPESDLYVTFRKELPGDPEEVLAAIPKKARAEVRRARDRFGLECTETRDLDTFFKLFARNKRRLGTPALPKRWFRALLDEFGNGVVVHVVHDPAKVPLAAVMSFCFKDTVHAYYSGSRSDQHKTGVNDFIYCKIMEWAAVQGYAVYDFGRSRRDTGAAHFKKNMGFEAQPLHYEYLLLDAGRELPKFNPSNPKLAVPQKIWASLPPFVAERLGGRLSRYLP
jgi:FemAB-related protein (PEP-CTERM system-associated)